MDGFKTSDLGLAAFLLFRGADLESWRTAIENGKARVEFSFTKARTEWVASYRRDDEGLQGYLAARRFLLRICNSEMTRK